MEVFIIFRIMCIGRNESMDYESLDLEIEGKYKQRTSLPDVQQKRESTSKAIKHQVGEKNSRVLKLKINLTRYYIFFLVGHALILCPFSLQKPQEYNLASEIMMPFFVFTASWGQVLLLWPLRPHILQQWCLEVLPLVLLDFEFLQVLLLWPFSPHNRHLNCLSDGLLSGQ